jgi:hypothetical protein
MNYAVTQKGKEPIKCTGTCKKHNVKVDNVVSIQGGFVTATINCLTKSCSNWGKAVPRTFQEGTEIIEE